MATTSLRLVAATAALLGLAVVPVHTAPASAGTDIAARRLTVPILMYHRIDYLRPTLPPMTRRLTVDPGEFARQMHWLVAHGFHTLTQRELYDALFEGRTLPARPVLITFDDGYRDVLGKASPVLAQLGLHATAYVISGRLAGADPSFLTAPQLRALERRGIEIGSHTITHAPLTRLDDEHALRELVASRRTLARAVGHDVPWFAYPYGAYDERVARLVARGGYRLAVTTRAGIWQDSRHPLELHRLEVLDTTGVSGLAALLRL
jgi:peptidoglycan/xylan/chitin deacetylase (PgdA/CDA1 family)